MKFKITQQLNFTMHSTHVFALSFVLVFLGACSSSDFSHSDAVANKLGVPGKENKNIITDLIINNILDIYAPVSGVVDNDLCRNHGQFYKERIKKGDLWALKMLDASSKIPDGLLMGNLIDMGNFDECLELEDVPSDFGSFSGQYCLVTMSQAGESVTQQRSVVQVVNEYSINAFKEENKATDSIEKTSGVIGSLGLPFQWSICVPSSCRPQDVKLHLQTALPGNVNVIATESNCYSKATERPFSANDWFAVGFMSFFGLLVVISTAYDLINLNKDSRKPVLAAFSVYTNGAKLLSPPSNSPDNLPCIHGVRFLSMAWVVLGHRYFFFSLSPSINRTVVFGYIQDWAHIFVTNATISVDSFLLLSGTLVCYIFMKEMEKRKSFNVFLYYLHRYIRLTPPYAVVILLTATLFNYWGDGPLLNTISDVARHSCQNNWWVNFLYLNNYVFPNEQCVGPSWYMAVDMQLFWLSPLVLLPLLKWPKIGKILLGGLIGVGLLTAFLVAFLNEFPVSFIASGDAGPMQYYPMHTRFTPWLIGIGLGYILHTTKNTPLRLSKIQLALGWFLSFGLMLTTWLLAHRFNQFDHQYERAFESIYTCLMRPGWALGLAWVIFACVKGFGGFINTFLSWSVFQILGRLTYCVYLIHFTILDWIYASMKQPLYISDQSIFMQYFADMVLSLAAAFVLSVVFESPAIIIERHFLGELNKKDDRTKKKNDDENMLHENVDKADKVDVEENEEAK